MMQPISAAEAEHMTKEIMQHGVRPPHFKAPKKVLWAWIDRHGGFIQFYRDEELRAARNRLPYKE